MYKKNPLLLIVKILVRKIDLCFAKFILFLIKLYKLILSPYLGRHCRFLPTCSTYTADSIKRFGTIKGTWLGLKRILRCNPFFEGGLDLIPETSNKKNRSNKNTNKKSS